MAVVVDFDGDTWVRLSGEDKEDAADYMTGVMEKYRVHVGNTSLYWAFDREAGTCTVCGVPLTPGEMAVEECEYSDPDDFMPLVSVPDTLVCFECMEDVYRHTTPRLRGDVLDPFRFHSVEG
jgi:hypothetical protein